MKDKILTVADKALSLFYIIASAGASIGCVIASILDFSKGGKTGFAYLVLALLIGAIAKMLLKEFREELNLKS
jgi:hypothetical protein